MTATIQTMRLAKDHAEALYTTLSSGMTAKAASLATSWGYTGDDEPPDPYVYPGPRGEYPRLPAIVVAPIGTSTVSDDDATPGDVVTAFRTGVLVNATSDEHAMNWTYVYTQAVNEVIAETRKLGDSAVYYAEVTDEEFGELVPGPAGGWDVASVVQVLIFGDERQRRRSDYY